MKDALFQKRSKASLKGWETRKQRLAEVFSRRKNIANLLSRTESQPSTANGPEIGITKWFTDKGMAQIYSSGLEFAFVSAAGEQCHPFAYCKDFLQDAVWAELNKSKASIYGFSYEHGKNPPVDLTNMRLAVRLKGNKDFPSMIPKALSFVQEVDKARGFQLTRVEAAGKYEGSENEVFVFVGDVRWLHSPTYVSFYSLAVRVGMTYEGGDWKKHFSSAKKYLGDNDKNYTEKAAKVLDKIIGENLNSLFSEKIEENYPKDCDVNSMHNNSGVVSFADNRVPAKLKEKWGK